MNKSRLISIVLIFSMLVSVGFQAMAEENGAVSSMPDIRSSLFDYMGIAVNTDATTVTRAEFATLLAITAGNHINITESEISDFDDVKATASNAPYIRGVNKAGLMNGVGERTFAPNSTISTNDAIVAVVRLAGYEPVALAYGGYPGGYMRVASERGITDGISVGTDPLTGEKLSQLLFNALHTEVYQLVSMGDTASYVSREGEDILYVYHNISKADAKVTANRYTSLFKNETPCSADEIALDNVRYKSVSDEMAQYLGMSVNAYYKKTASDKIGTVVAIAEDETMNKTLVIKREDISSIADHKLTYFDGKKDITVKIERGFSFIYNGKLYPNGVASELLADDSVLTLIDSNSDRVYETVSMEKGETVIVASVERSKYVIYGENQKTVRFDDSYPSSTLVITDKDGAESYIDRIKTGNVVTVYSSKDNQYVKIVISTDTVKGTIVELDSQERTVKVKTNKETLDYKIATGYENDFVIGLSGEFYIDSFGKLVYSKNKPGSDYQYGYLFSGRFESAMSAAELMILTSVDFEVFECAPSVVIDGNKVTLAQNSSNNIYDGTNFVQQMLRFKADGNGVIRFIDTENVGTGDAENDKLNPSLKIPVSGGYTPFFSSIASKCQVGADTVFLKVPGAEDTNTTFNPGMLTDKDYYSNSKDLLGEGKTINVAYAYEMDDTLTPKAILYYNNSLGVTGSGRIDNYTKLAVVLEHFRCLDSEGDARDALRVFTEGGQETVLYFNDEYNVSKLMEFGDTIFYITDSKNCITQWSYDLDYSALSSDVKDGYWPRYIGYPYSKADNVFSFLSVKSNANLVSDSGQTMADNSNPISESQDFMRVFPTKVMTFIEVDFKTGKAEKVTYADIDSFKHTKNTDKIAYVKTYRGGGNYEDIMFIYKNTAYNPIGGGN